MESGYAMAETESPRAERQVKKVAKKSNFFKRWLLSMVKEEVARERGEQVNQKERNYVPATLAIGGISTSQSIDQPERAIHFTVFNANGGRVVETRRNDRKSDRSYNGLYIITNDQDFGREIDKIITMEALK